MAYSDETKEMAKSLFLQRNTPDEICKKLNLNSSRIVYEWASKFGWADMLSKEGVEVAITRRIIQLTLIDNKTPGQLKEQESLINQHVKLKKLQALEANPDHTERREKSNAGTSKGKKKNKNDISHLKEDDFKIWIDSLFEYQRLMRNVKNDPKMPRTRNVLKSRQVGFTYGCAGEAFEDAILTGRNQIFISATRAQAEVFRSYIIKISREFFELEITGNPIVLSNGAEMHFLATSASSAQSRAGNVYVDEYFWIRDFNKVSSVVGACATQKKYHKTYFSTPSAKNHPAYPFWTGEKWRGDVTKRKNIAFPSDKEMRNGAVCPDKQWRYIIDVNDAVKGGCHLIDPEEIKEENSPDAFSNLYLCQFVDDSSSVFKFNIVEKMMVDESKWTDFNTDNERPFENREVWLGYDPSRTRDNACLVIIAPAIGNKNKFRVLKKIYWRGLNFQHHVSEIRKIMHTYNVTYLGMDVTGIGAGVYDLLNSEFPREVVPIHYSNESKNRLVLKMIDVVNSKRLEFSADEKDIAAAFMAIKRGSTASGNMMAFKAERSALAGHADAFWAISHALINEPLNAETSRSSSYTLGR